MRRIRRIVGLAGHLAAFYLVARWLERSYRETHELLEATRLAQIRIAELIEPRRP